MYPICAYGHGHERLEYGVTPQSPSPATYNIYMGHSMLFCSAKLLDSCIHVNMGESSWVGRDVRAYSSEPRLTRSMNLSRPCSNVRDQRTWAGTYPSYEYVVLCCDAIANRESGSYFGGASATI